MTRTIFQLSARGNSANGGIFKSISRDVFATVPGAESHMEEFKARCCDRSQFDFAAADGLEIRIIDLELHE